MAFSCALAHTYIREFSEGKLEVKLNGAISAVQFNLPIFSKNSSLFFTPALSYKIVR